MVEGVVGVDPHGSSLEGVSDFDGSVEILGVDSGGETVGGGVSDLDGILLGLEFAMKYPWSPLRLPPISTLAPASLPALM